MRPADGYCRRPARVGCPGPASARSERIDRPSRPELFRAAGMSNGQTVAGVPDTRGNPWHASTPTSFAPSSDRAPTRPAHPGLLRNAFLAPGPSCCGFIHHVNAIEAAPLGLRTGLGRDPGWRSGRDTRHDGMYLSRGCGSSSSDTGRIGQNVAAASMATCLADQHSSALDCHKLSYVMPYRKADS